MRSTPHNPPRAVSLTQAATESPVLVHLGALVERSKQHLSTVDSVFPQSLRSQVIAGPVGEGVWCLLVKNASVASKVRQLLPDLEARLLAVYGHETKIRVKVLNS